MYLSGDLELSDAPEPDVTILSRTPAHTAHTSGGGSSGRGEPLELGDTVSIHYAARLARSPPESDPFDSTRPMAFKKSTGEREGEGRAEAESEGGGSVMVDEDGRVLDPEFFDADDSNAGDLGGAGPFQFKLGAHSVINGLETAVLQHMAQPGDRLAVFMPSGAAYGSLGAGDGVVPPYEDLTFEIELVEVTRATPGRAH